MSGSVQARLLVNASNVHQGGGLVLLHSLLGAIPDESPAIVWVDARMPVPARLARQTVVHRVPPTILDRLRAERMLARLATPQDRVLCFGNLPPLFRLDADVTVLLQNRYLLANCDLGGFTFHTRLRLWAERQWLMRRQRNAARYAVQTPTMKRLAQAALGNGCDIRILPFVEAKGADIPIPRAGPAMPDHDFVYVASGEPHKNHRKLVEAWRMLAEAGLRPGLILTLDRRTVPDLCGWIEEQAGLYDLRVTNLGPLGHDQVLQLYRQAGALIYPSVMESFGLPLLEAMRFGVPILAGELDYVRDVASPLQTFDPESPLSIARAVRRYLGVEDAPLVPLVAKEFLDRLMGEGAAQ